jgi:hypothetical protein
MEAVEFSGADPSPPSLRERYHLRSGAFGAPVLVAPISRREREHYLHGAGTLTPALSHGERE